MGLSKKALMGTPQTKFGPYSFKIKGVPGYKGQSKILPWALNKPDLGPLAVYILYISLFLASSGPVRYWLAWKWKLYGWHVDSRVISAANRSLCRNEIHNKIENLVTETTMPRSWHDESLTPRSHASHFMFPQFLQSCTRKRYSFRNVVLGKLL